MRKLLRSFTFYYFIPATVLSACFAAGYFYAFFGVCANIVTAVCLILLAGFLLWQTRSLKKERAEMHSDAFAADSLLFEKAETMRSCPEKYFQKVKLLLFYSKTLICAYIAATCLAAAALASAISGTGLNFFAVMIPALLLLTILLKPAFGSFFSRDEEEQRCYRLSPYEYPRVNRLAREAATLAGLDGAAVFLSPESVMTAKISGKTVSFIMGIQCFYIMTEGELYDTFKTLARFYSLPRTAFLQKAADADAKETASAFDFSGNRIITTPLLRAEKLIPALKAAWYPSLMLQSAVNAHAGENLTRACLKFQMYDLFSFSQSRYMSDPYYRPSHPRENGCSYPCVSFENAAKENGRKWTDMLLGAVKPRNSLFPSPSEFISALGTSNVTPVFPDDNDAVHAEAVRFAHYMDDTIRKIDLFSSGYDTARQIYFVAPSAVTEKFELEGGLSGDAERLTAEALRPVADAYIALIKPDSAEKICDFLLEKHRRPPAFALLMKGKLLLERYDERGIALLEQAVERQPESVYDAAVPGMEFFRLTGQAEKLASFRDKMALYASLAEQKSESFSAPTKKDVLAPADMPADLLDDITRELSRQNGALDCAYSVIKKQPGAHPCFFIVLQFDKNADDTERSEIMQNVFYFLDARSEQFCLLSEGQLPRTVFSYIRALKGAQFYKRGANQ